MSARDRVVVVVLIMVGVATFVAAVWGGGLYRTAIEEQRGWLLRLVQSQAGLIESVAVFDSDHFQKTKEQTRWSETIYQIAAANKSFLGFGETGEFVLGRRNGGNIEFVLKQRFSESGPPDSIPFDSRLAEPMRKALLGETGTIIGLDYRNVMVLAAFGPIKDMGVGLVAKIDLSEVRAPYIRFSLIGVVSAFAVIILGAILAHRMSATLMKSLEASVLKLKEAQSLSHIGHWEWDIKTGGLDWSDEIYRIFGHKPGEFEATYENFLSSIHPDDLEKVESAIAKALDKGGKYIVDHRVVLKGNEERFVREQGFVTMSASGVPERMIGTTQDVTDLRFAEREASKLFQAVEGSSVLVLMADTKGIIEYINPAFSRISGYSKEEAIGQRTNLLKSGFTSPETYKDLWRTIQSGKVWKGIFKNKRKDGSFFWSSSTISPVLIDGKVAYYSSIQEDYSDRKEAEEKLVARTIELNRTNKALEQFAYVASHDLQEPLRAVASYTQLLAKRYEGKLDEKADKYIRNAHEGALRMQRLIEGLLVFSRIHSKEQACSPVDCNEILGEVVKNLELAIAREQATIVSGPLPTLMADGNQLMTVFQNLIANALKFRSDAAPRVEIKSELLDDEWHITVSDNGIGLEQEFAESIFGIFQRLHVRSVYPGEGLGLAICKQIIEHHGGKIWVESSTGNGATFHFTLRETGSEK